MLDSLPINIPDRTTIHIDTKIAGRLKNLKIDHVKLETLTATSINASGNIQLRLNQDPYLALDLEKFYTTKSDVESIVPDTLLPSSIALPDWLNIKANLRGTFTSPSVKTILTSNLGTIELNGTLKREGNSGISKYSGALNLKDFQTGKLLKQEEILGPVTLTASVDGSGLKMEELDARVKLHVVSFTYQHYNYRDFTLDGTLKKYFFSGIAQLKDENLDFRLEGDLDYNEEVPDYKFKFELKNADFKALNFTSRPLKARGTLDINLATSDFKVINGDLDIRKFAIYNGKDVYMVDSLLAASIDQEGRSEISLRSDIVDGNFEGTLNLYSLPEVIRRHFNNYFALHDTAYNKPAAPQNFQFDLVLKNTDLLTEVIFPDLDPFIPGKINGKFDSEKDQLDLGIGLAKMRYAGVGADSITFTMTSDSKALAYTLALRKITMDTLRIEALKLEGNVANDSIRTKLVILDSLQKDKYILERVFNSLEKVFQFRFLQDEVIMNYAPWTTPADNSLQFTSTGIQANNFSITNINERIAFVTSNDKDSIASLQFKDLNLQNITNLIEGAIPFDGLANGTLNMMAAEEGCIQLET